MLPLQWVAWGLLLVVLDLSLDGWDLTADPLAWAVVLHGTWRLRTVLGTGVSVAAVVALALSVLTWPPGLLPELDPALSWALSLPEEAFCLLLALRLRDVLPERRRTLQLLAWGFVVVALSPPVVLVSRSVPLVLLLAGLAVVVTVWLVVVLFLAARQLPTDEPA